LRMGPKLVERGSVRPTFVKKFSPICNPRSNPYIYEFIGKPSLKVRVNGHWISVWLSRGKF
ncbi:hypothetical protein CISIN_1g0443902mg, partial [Citrus sinensis]